MRCKKFKWRIKLKLNIGKQTYAFEIEKQKAEAQLKGQLMQKEFNYNMQLQGMTQEQLGI